MSSSPLSDSSFNPREPIPGYVTRELIGRGGFGEVWKAEAPGGLLKAIKIVHAGVDSTRAERELRALQRIRDVRHPLILSIERIEIIAGSLVIVTELADCSLRELFQKYRSQKQPGIPREQLLAMLRDAADALDYIYEEYSLQHLDIKPENLLVVGNRLKLGDFGLIKNIYERGASLVNGLTPTYAPPELFEGKPTRQSDQYSLAIVYQHMLTGELPFEGATPAQLAREHLAGVPRLTLLSKAERPIVARALAKSPADRFESCKTLIDSLAKAPIDQEELSGSDHRPNAAGAARTHTLSLSDGPIDTPAHDATASIVTPAIVPAKGDGSVDPVLGALEVSLQPTRRAGDTTSRRSDAIPGSGFVPTVLIGIGGAGGMVLQELKSRIEDNVAPLSAIPALQMVLMDTDGRSLNALMHEQGLSQALDIAALPLRRPEDYKFRESRLSKWLHRRWIYNMPRSLSTEGYRPLGRLALVDHGPRVITSIKTAIARASASESAAKSASTTGLPFKHGHVRIVIVAAISGATGSGMLLDVAYAVRSELKKRSLSDEDVLAFLLHSAPGNPSERDKAVANAYALLSELGHYSSPGHFYPGEQALDTPQFHGDNRTFRSAYLIDLGQEVDASRRQAATAEVAEYLYLTTTTPAKLVVDAARHADEVPAERARTSVLLRSLSVHRFDHVYGPDVSAATVQACRDVVALWSSDRPHKATPSTPGSPLERSSVIDMAAEPANPADAVAASRATELLSQTGLEPDTLLFWARNLTEQVWQGDESAYLQSVFQQVCESGVDGRRSRKAIVEGALRVVDRLLSDAPLDDRDTSLRAQLKAALSESATVMSQQLTACLRAHVDGDDGGAGAARAVAAAVAAQVMEVHNELERRRRACAESSSDTARQLLNGPPPGSKSGFKLFRRRRRRSNAAAGLIADLTGYAVQRLDEARLSALEHFLMQMHAQIVALADQLVQLSRELACLGAEFQGGEEPSPAGHEYGPETRAFVERVKQSLHQDRDAIARAVRRDLYNGTLAGEQKLQRFLGGRTELHSVLRAPLFDAARRVIADHVRQTTLQWIAESAQESETQPETACGRLVSEFLEERRAKTATALDPVLVLVPDQVEPALLGKAFASCKEARLVPARTNGITVFAEVTPRPLEDVADELIQHQELYRQLAQKLHTREDVDWSPLPPPRSAKKGLSSPSVHVHTGAFR